MVATQGHAFKRQSLPLYAGRAIQSPLAYFGAGRAGQSFIINVVLGCTIFVSHIGVLDSVLVVQAQSLRAM